MNEIKINDYLSVKLNEDGDILILFASKVLLNLNSNLAKLLSNALSELAN